MRLDYMLYVLAAVLLIITVVPFVVPIGVETMETRSVWVIASVVLGLLSIGLGYSQRPRTEAQSCQPTAPVAQETIPETQPATTMETVKEEKPQATIEKAAMKEAAAVSASAAAMVGLTKVKGVGEKRAIQLKALGINSADDLANASAQAIAKKLKISPKIAKKWIMSAKELAK
jgi:predicted flap endonuclease-1-like 5' DNA nuclease